MASVFISYSRKDQDFVRKLYDALKAAGRDAWVDWEGIPPTAEWLSEVYAAVDGADTFVFILSPDSVDSEICGKEVAHAVESKKRIIPIVCRQVGAAEVKAVESLAPLVALNWIFMRESDDFEKAFEQLLFALDTDLDYWHLSSDLLVRAKRWEEGAKNAHLTVRGPELASAERWLTQGADKEPRPTALQLDYITASRNDANARQRRLLTGVSAALIVTLILAVVSFTQFQLAQRTEQQAVRAERQALDNLQIAFSRQLAAQSITHLDDQPDLALLLGVQSYRTLPTVEARDSLLTALEHSPRLAGFLYNLKQANGNMALSPEGTELAVPIQISSTQIQIAFYDPHTLKPAGQPLPATTTQITRVDYSPDGKLLASIDDTGLVTLWSTSTRKPVGQPLAAPGIRQAAASEGGAIGDLIFSPNGKLLAVTSERLTAIVIYDLALDVWMDASKSNPDLTSNDFYGASITWRADSGALVLVTLLPANFQSKDTPLLGDIIVWDLARHARVSDQHFVEATQVTDWSLSPDGRTLAVAVCDIGALQSMADCHHSHVELWDARTGNSLGAPINAFDAGSITPVRFSPDGKLLAMGDDSGSISLWNMETGRLDETLRSSGAATPVGQLAFSGDGSTLVSSYTSLTGAVTPVVVWNMASRQPLARPVVHSTPETSQVYRASVSPDGRFVAVATCSATAVCSIYEQHVSVWEVATGRAIGQLPDTVRGLAFSPDNTTVATSECVQQDTVGVCNQSRIALRDRTGTATPALLGSLSDGPFFDATGLVFSPDGRLLAAEVDRGGTHRVAVWDVQTRQEWRTKLQDPAVAFEFPFDPSFSRDGATLAAGGGRSACSGSSDTSAQACDHIRLWDLRTGHIRAKFTLPQGEEANQIAFSRDGQTLASHDTHGRQVEVWNTATGHIVDQPGIPNVASMSLSPDGHLLALGYCGAIEDAGGTCAGPAIQLWDIPSHRRIGPPLVSHTGFVKALVTIDGISLVSSGNGDDLVLLWQISYQTWLARACQIANRNLTQAEWKAFVGTIEPYQKTCPNLPAGT